MKLPAPAPHETLALKNYSNALQSTETSARTCVRGVRLTHQPDTDALIAASAIYQDAQGAWHDLDLRFHTQADGGRKLTPTPETTNAAPTHEYLGAIKHLSEIIRSAIGFYRVRITTAIEDGHDRAEASSHVMTVLNTIAIKSLGDTRPAVIANQDKNLIPAS